LVELIVVMSISAILAAVAIMFYPRDHDIKSAALAERMLNYAVSDRQGLGFVDPEDVGSTTAYANWLQAQYYPPGDHQQHFTAGPVGSKDHNEVSLLPFDTRPTTSGGDIPQSLVVTAWSPTGDCWSTAYIGVGGSESGLGPGTWYGLTKAAADGDCSASIPSTTTGTWSRKPIQRTTSRKGPLVTAS
jgi:hypothetical protein